MFLNIKSINEILYKYFSFPSKKYLNNIKIIIDVFVPYGGADIVMIEKKSIFLIRNKLDSRNITKT